jgi:DNA-binding transcriptional regulator YiaG
MSRKYRSGIMAAIHKTAADIFAAGGIDEETMRKFDALRLTAPD